MTYTVSSTTTTVESTKTTRTQWSSRERETVAQQYQVLSTQFPNMSFLELIRRSQSGLEPERRRKIVSKQAVPWINDVVKDLKNGISVTEMMANAKAEVSTKTNAEREMLDQLCDKVIERLAERMPQMMLGFVDSIADAVSKQVSYQILDEIKVEHTRSTTDQYSVSVRSSAEPTIPEPQQETPSSKEVAQEHLARILIVGPNSDQRRELTKKYESLVELDFWKEEKYPVLANKCGSADYVFVMNQFVDGGVRDILKRHAPGKYECVSGSGSALKRAIDKYFLKYLETIV